jgi:Flp pilus assembly protein TadB
VLSDHERKTLREIQRQLFVDDPDFQRSFRALDAQPPTRPAAPTPEPLPASPSANRWIYTTVIITAALLALLLMLAGSLGGALAFIIIAGSMWLVRRLEHSARQHKRGE